MRWRTSSAFTLTELMICVAIIAVLASFVLPLIPRVRESARRVVCASNIRQWGMAFMGLAQDDRGRIPALPTEHWYNDPMGLWWVSSWASSPQDRWGTRWDRADELSVEKIAPYMPGADQADPATLIVNGSWQCPSSPGRRRNLYIWTGDPSSWFGSSYAYFGWGQSFPRPPGHSRGVGTDRLVDRRIRADGLLMADAHSAWVQDAVSLNAGPYPNHSVRFRAGDPDRAALAGQNQLYGDGHVQWKQRVEYRSGVTTGDPWSNDADFVGDRMDRTWF